MIKYRQMKESMDHLYFSGVQIDSVSTFTNTVHDRTGTSTLSPLEGDSEEENGGFNSIDSLLLKTQFRDESIAFQDIIF